MYERDDELMVDDLTPEERARLREAWETLDPDDDLEAAVVGLARSAEPEKRGRVIPLWIPAVGLAAAVLLLAVFSRPDDLVEPEVAVETPAGDPQDDGAPPAMGDLRIWSPPSLSQVEAARARNASFDGGIAPGAVGTRVRYQSAGLSGPISGGFDEKGIPPQSEHTTHRYIERQTWEPGEKKIRSVPFVPRPLRARIGWALMQAARSTSKDPLMRAGRRSAIDVHDTVVLEIRTPEKTPATTRLRVRVDPAYPGFAIVPEDVARGLGLQQFEVRGPAGVADESEITHGYRVRAVLALPAHDFEQEVEVFVPRARRPQLLSMEDMDSSAAVLKPMVRLYGEAPSYISMTQRISFTVDPEEPADGRVVRFHGRTALNKPSEAERKNGNTAVPIPFDGPVSLLLDYDDDKGRRLWLPPLEIGGDFGTAVSAYVGEVTWRADATQCPPGSTFVASTIWRGSRAHVGPAGVAFGTVSKDGVFEATFLEHADLGGLRAHVTRPDGSHVFVDAQLADPGGAIGLLQHSDKCLIVAARDIASVAPDQDLSDEPPAEDDAVALKALLEELPDQLAKGPREEVGFILSPSEPYRLVEAVMEAAAQAGIRTFRIQIVDDIEPSQVETIRLPSDQALAPKKKDGGEELTSILQALLAVKEDGRLSLEWRRGASDATGAVVANDHPGESWTGSPRPPFVGSDRIEKLRDWWKSDGRYVLIVVDDAWKVPGSAVHELLRACREAGITDVRFQAPSR